MLIWRCEVTIMKKYYIPIFLEWAIFFYITLQITRYSFPMGQNPFQLSRHKFQIITSMGLWLSYSVSQASSEIFLLWVSCNQVLLVCPEEIQTSCQTSICPCLSFTAGKSPIHIHLNIQQLLTHRARRECFMLCDEKLSWPESSASVYLETTTNIILD